MKTKPSDTVSPHTVEMAIAERAGLTKREWFAGLAMQGLCASGGYLDEYPVGLVIDAVATANEIIAALNEEPE